MATKFTPSRNVTSGDTQNTGPSDSTHEVTGTLSITGSLFLNGVQITGAGGGGTGAAGNPTEVQFNTGMLLDASSNFTFNGTRVSMVTASAQVFATPNNAILLAPNFSGGGPGYMSGTISIASSSQGHGLWIMDFNGPPGPPKVHMAAGGLTFNSTNINYDPAQGTFGPQLATPHYDGGGAGITIAPSFDAGAFGAPVPFYASHMITIASASGPHGYLIMPGGPGGSPNLMITAGALTYSGSNTTTPTGSGIVHPQIAAHVFGTVNGAIQMGHVGDPNGPGNPPGTIYQSGTLLIQSGAFNRLMLMGSGDGPSILANSNGIQLSGGCNLDLAANAGINANSGSFIVVHGDMGPSTIITSTGITLRTSASLRTNNGAIMIGPDFSDFGEGHASGAIMIQASTNPESDSMSGIFIMPADDEEAEHHFFASNFGVMIGPPKSEDGMYTALNVNMTGILDPTRRLGGMDHGGGEVVFYGTGPTDIGKLYYLKSDGVWAQADASVTGSGHNQLLAMAMGSSSAQQDGMLIRGFYNALTAYSGAYINGGPVYVGTELGTVSGAAPVTSNEYVRVVGYGATSGSLIYFNPDATYIEIA